MTDTPLPAGRLASRTAPASRGIEWLFDGFRHFRADWSSWLAASIILTLVSVFLQVLVPVLGTIILFLFTPVFLGGLMQGLAGTERGRHFAVSDLFVAFSGPSTGQLVLIGLAWLILNTAAMVLSAVVLVVFAGMDLLDHLAQSEDMLAAARALTLGIGLAFALLVYVALLIPITMLVWFAPALVVIEGEDALAAMKHSFVGCLRNFMPYLLYGLVGLVVFPVLLVLTLGFGSLLLIPVGLASIYSAYKDIFHRP